MTTLAAGSSVTVAVRDGGTVAIATNGGLASAVVTLTEGGSSTVSLGPLAERRVLGPFKEGASVVISNATCGSLDYDVETTFDPSSVAITGGTIGGVAVSTIAAQAGGGGSNTMMFIGDSWGARSYVNSAGSYSYADIGAITWAQALSTQRLDILNPDAALGGTTTSDWWTGGRLAAQMSGYTPAWVVVFLGTNDISGDTPLATTQANLSAIYGYILAKGAKLVCLTVPPYGSTYVTQGASLATKNANRAILNQWIANYVAAHSNCFLVDQFSLLVNPTDTSGYMQAAYNDTNGTTGLHSSAAGSRVVGQAIANIFNTFATDGHLHVSSYIDSYDYDSTSSNRLSNPLMQGSGGTSSPGAGTTVTGTIPTSWSVVTVAGTSTTTCSTPARTVSTDGDAIGNNARLVITGAGSADVVSLKTGSISSRFAQGDIVQGEMFVKVSSATNLKGIRLLMQSVQGGTTYTSTGMSYLGTGFSYDSANSTLVIRTPPLTIGAGALTGHILGLDIAFGGSGGATVDIGRASWRKLN